MVGRKSKRGWHRVNKPKRQRLFETPEPRFMLAADWQNQFDQLDVDDDLNVTEVDFFRVVDDLNEHGLALMNASKNFVERRLN